VSVLAKVIAEHCYKQGKFKLTSGGTDSNYVDLWEIIGNPFFADILRKSYYYPFQEIDGIGGPAYASLPIAIHLASVVNLRDRSIKLPFVFTVRKEPKDHGTGKLIEGPKILPGHRILLVEDVTSTGKSLLHAANAVRSFGSVVLGALAVVEREGEGSRELLHSNAISLYNMTTLEEVLGYVK
jgi:orotate phosphoribosyltransferase